MTQTTLLTGGSFFEGPRWHDGSWWVSDFYRGTVSRVSPAGEETVVLEVPGGELPRRAERAVRDHRRERHEPGHLQVGPGQEQGSGDQPQSQRHGHAGAALPPAGLAPAYAFDADSTEAIGSGLYPAARQGVKNACT